MKSIVINGLSLGFADKITGIQRACHELIYRLDELLADERDLQVKYLYNVDDLNKVIVPETLKNIQPIPVKHDGKRFFKTRIIRSVLKKENADLCCLSLETAFVKNQINFIYDLRAVTTKFDTVKFRLKHRLFLFLQKRHGRHFLTDSNYQKQELVRYLRVPPEKITTLYMGYEHMNGVKADAGIFKKFPQLKAGGFYYTLGSLAPHKNMIWVAEVAKRNPDKIFAVAGGKDLKVWKDNVEIKGVGNLVFLGYVSDAESRALMENCLAFVFPSKYEGFGIPPLEALACGAKILISNATCLPEVYEDCAAYFDPDDYDVDLDGLLAAEVAAPQKIFEKCSWDTSAEKLLELLKSDHPGAVSG